MSEMSETPEKADSESRCSTPRAASITSLDFDESSKAERRVRSSRSSTPVTKALRPRVKVSESPSSSHGEKYEDDDEESMDEGPLVIKRKTAEAGQIVHDAYCWICHKELLEVNCKECSSCLRSYHPKCAPATKAGSPLKSEAWECPECSPFSYEIAPRSTGTPDQFNSLFKYLIERAVGQTAEPFVNPVDLKEFPQYLDYIIYPVCISHIEDKISKGHYLGPRELLSDFKWIYHNSVIFNSPQAKLTSIAKQMLRVVKEETKEIENCPNCLYNAYSLKPDWFIQACDRPHLLVWAKMKGFPYWPAKAMSFNNSRTLVDVRFFGKHDRAYLPIVDCMLYTSWYPAPAQVKKPREDVAACIKEVDQHIEKLKEKFGSFVYASNITFLNPKDMEGQVKKMLPNYSPEESGKRPTPGVATSLEGLTALKPSVVLTRLTDAETGATPQGSPSRIVNSGSASRKNSTDEDSRSSSVSSLTKLKSTVVAEALASREIPKPLPPKTPPVVSASAKISTKSPLKRKIGPASKLKELNKGLSPKETNKSEPEVDAKVDFAAMLDAFESNLTDSDDDDIDDFIEDELRESPAKKPKVEPPIEKEINTKPIKEQPPAAKTAEKSDQEASSSKDKESTGNEAKPVVSKDRQRKIAEGMKALDNLKIYGLDVMPVPVESTSPLSPSYADMSSDSSEFIESDMEMDKDTFKHEDVEIMEVEPDLAIPGIIQKPAQKPKPAGKKPAANAPAKSSAKNKNPIKIAPAPATIPKALPQSILKSNAVPNKARKTVSPGSILSQRLTKPPNPAKKVPTSMIQKKQILVTHTTNPVQQVEPIKININVPPPVPDSAGPSTTMLNATADKLADYMKQSVYSLINDLTKNTKEDLKTENAQLKLQIETMKWHHQMTIAEIMRNHEISLQELDVLVEENVLRAKLECQRGTSDELRKAVNDAKRKTWCSVCLMEASLYCCWNTSYCSFICQKKHWLEHKSICKSKMTTNALNKPEVCFSNGPSSGTSMNKSVVFMAPGQSNGTASSMTKKQIAANTLPPHAVFGTSAEVTAALPQLFGAASQSGDVVVTSKLPELGMGGGTHLVVAPNLNPIQVKLPAGIHHTSLPATVSARTGLTMAKPSSVQVTSTPLFQFYKESTE